MNKNENENEIVSFKVITRKCLYNSPDFKIYSCEPSFKNSSELQHLKMNTYGGITIKGNFQELDIDCGYTVKGIAVEDKKYGYGYSVQNIRRDVPQTVETSRQFLLSVITEQQTETLLAAYPNIVSRIVNDDLDDIDLNKTKGIKEYTFEVIKRKVIENFKLAELVEEYGGVFSLAIIRKLYDTYPSIEKIRDNLVENPYECLCKLGGVGFKSADELLLKLEKESKERIKQDKKSIIQFSCDLISSYQRMKSCIVFLIEQSESEGNTYIDGRELHKQCKEIVSEAIHNFADVLKNEEDIHFDRDSAKVAKIYTYNTEKYIADRIREGLTIKNVWNVDYTKYYKVDDFELSDEQKQTCKSVCENTITILVGNGGSGKSFSTKALINLLNDNNKHALLLAPTGRASKVLADYANHPASTIHRGLGFKPPKTWSYNEETKLDCDIVILDEFSMVDIFLFRHLLEAIDFTKTKLLLIGDDAQIPSVACGNLLHDFLNSDRIPTVRLTKIFRYGKGGINTVATDIRTGKPSFDKNNTDTQIIGDDKGFIYTPMAQEKAINYIVKLYKKLLEKGIDKNDILILVSQNIGDYGTQRINKRIQFEVNPESSKYVKYGEIEYRVNDLVIQCVNNYKSYIYTQYGCNDEKTFISNGEIGKIVDVVYDRGEYGIVVDFGNKNLIFIPKSQLGTIKLGYAISLHKSQGGQAKYIIVFAPKAHTYMLNSNLLYVGVTRAKEKCILIGELETYNRSIKKKENLARNTFMCELLKGGQNE